MTLKITEEKGVFNLEGAVNSITAQNFKNRIEAVMTKLESLVINIENVTEIDRSGMGVFHSLYAYSKAHNIKFYIIGIGCKEVCDDLYLANVA